MSRYDEFKEILKAEDKRRGIDPEKGFQNLLNMTDEQAASVIENMFFEPQMLGGRHQGKQYLYAMRTVAILKAINRLRGISDNESEDNE